MFRPLLRILGLLRSERKRACHQKDKSATMKSQRDNRISLPEELTNAQLVTPKRATGLLAPLSGASEQREASQNEIATILRDADSLVPDAVDRSNRTRIEPTESGLAVERTLLPTEVPLPKPVDLTGVFRMVPAADMNHPLWNAGESEERDSVPGSLPRTPLSQRAQSSGEVEEAEGFTKIFQSLSASTVSDAVPDSTKVRESESSSHVEMPRGSAEPVATFGSPTRNAKVTEFAEYRDGNGSWGEPRYKREQTSANGAPQMGGGFTQLLRTLSKDMDEPSPERVIPEPVIRIARDLDGPGEFTRIISDSMLREAQGRTPMPVPVSQFPAETPRDIPVQGVSARAAIPEAPLPRAADVPLSLAMASSQNFPSQYVPPQPAASPQPGIPHAPTGGMPPFFERLQSYVPLLLVVNVFLMLLVLLALGVVMMRR
jgi:hypothetical protein